MSIAVTYRCNGCQTAVEVTGIRRTWEVVGPAAVVGGVSVDRCLMRTPTIESAAPEGWMPFDPYTGVCYCPECWAQIETQIESAKPTPERVA